MHDPLCVAFEIRRPWPKGTNGPSGRRYWPSMVTVWHREPNGNDSGTVCPYAVHWRHPWHFRIQVHALQRARRWLLTRCAWCGGKSRRGDVVNHSRQWDGPKSHWWQGERGLYHFDCSSIASAHGQCTCERPVCEQHSVEYGPYGKCARCGKGRSFGRTDEQIGRMRKLAAIPAGARHA